jgi:plastocyanin
MATVATPLVKRRDWRTIVFRILAGLFALLFLVVQLGLPALVEPWVLIASDAPGYTAAIHRMHEAHWATIMVFCYGAGLLALAWRPRAYPLLLQFILLVNLIEAGGNLLIGQFDPVYETILFLCLAVLVAAYPAPRDLLHFAPEGSLSVPLFGLSLLAAALLAPDTRYLLHLQFAGLGGEHATQNHWMLTAELELMLVVGGLLAATKRPGWRVLGLLVGLALIYLGVASISAPHLDGSWGTLGGALATLGGWGFVGATFWEARRAAATAPQHGWLPYALIALAAGLSAALFLLPQLGTAASDAAPAGTTVLAAREYQFEQRELHVKVGAPVALQLDNRDNSIHQFDLDELNVHVPMPAGERAVAQFTPTQPGTYTFYCTLHVDRTTKQGMAGTLIVAP